jgi:glutamate synthase (NADPH/NADH) small chain
MLSDMDVTLDERKNIKADTKTYQTNQKKIFTAGDMRRGQSLVVWAINEGRECAEKVNLFLQ